MVNSRLCSCMYFSKSCVYPALSRGSSWQRGFTNASWESTLCLDFSLSACVPWVLSGWCQRRRFLRTSGCFPPWYFGSGGRSRTSWTGDRATASLALLLLPSSSSDLLVAARDRLPSPSLVLSPRVRPCCRWFGLLRDGIRTLHPECWASARLQLHSLRTLGQMSYSSYAKRPPALSVVAMPLNFAIQRGIWYPSISWNLMVVFSMWSTGSRWVTVAALEQIPQ